MPVPEPDPVQRLIARLRQEPDNEQVVADFYQIIAGYVEREVERMVKGDPQGTGEVLNDCVLALRRRIRREDLAPINSLKGLARRAAKNRALNWLEREGRRHTSVADVVDEALHIADSNADPASRYDRAEGIRAVQSAVRSLKDRARRIVEAHGLNAEPIAVVAADLGCSEAVVRHEYSRAIPRLRELLSARGIWQA